MNDHPATQVLLEKLLHVSESVRYVACEQQGKVFSATKQSRDNASSAESDKYEELFVNPALLTLTHQRGEFDCGGTKYVLIRYGNFFQWIRRWDNGHISVCLEPDADIFACIQRVEDFLAQLVDEKVSDS